jgi:hypothetical protein
LLLEYNDCISFRIELADEEIPNAAQRDAEYDEFDNELLSRHNLQDWRVFWCLARQNGLM